MSYQGTNVNELINSYLHRSASKKNLTAMRSFSHHALNFYKNRVKSSNSSSP